MNRLYFILIPFLLTGCAAMMPDAIKTNNEVAPGDCITIKVDRTAFKKDTDVKITVDAVNKDPAPGATK